MSGRFVSGGTISSTGGEDAKDGSTIEAREPLAKQSTEWEVVQQELEADRKRREEQRLNSATGQEQSLYDILQANKAAKQAAFEEQNKLKNQFRALDDDEIEFLDEVRAKERQEAERAKKELEQGLKAFREKQKTGGDGTSNPSEKQDDGTAAAAVGDEEWAVGGRKRKRVKEREVVKGVKRKTTEESVLAATSPKKEGDGNDITNAKAAEKKSEDKPKPLAAQEKKKGLSLVAYGSDDSDDE